MHRLKKIAPGNARGFSLIELMVVIVIIGLLVSIIAPRFMDAPGKAKQVKAKATIEALESSLKMYKLDNGSYPTTEQGLTALVQQPANTGPTWKKGGYLEKGQVPKDPWNNEYIYLSPGLHGDFDIITYGLDGIPGGEEENADINNWDIQ
jgi:general secretion pathway protein G